MLAGPAHVLAILPELNHALDDGQAIFKALALGEALIMRLGYGFDGELTVEPLTALSLLKGGTIE